MNAFALVLSLSNIWESCSITHSSWTGRITCCSWDAAPLPPPPPPPPPSLPPLPPLPLSSLPPSSPLSGSFHLKSFLKAFLTLSDMVVVVAMVLVADYIMVIVIVDLYGVRVWTRSVGVVEV